MAVIHDLLSKIEDADLRDRLAKEVDKLTKRKKFGLVFEEHIPECTPLYDIPIKLGANVAMKTGYVNDIYTVIEINGDTVLCRHKETHEQKTFGKDEVVVVAEFGEPIYPYLKPIDSICNAPDNDLWHTLIEADNYHALQLLEYLYAGKVDCIYIDPPYNTGAKDWKYNNDYVDSSDSYRHSKWLSMMEKRLKIAKKLLNPKDSVLIVTIDEKEYLHLGCLLEEMFPEARIQMITIMTNKKGQPRAGIFSRSEEYIYVLFFGDASVVRTTDNMLFSEQNPNNSTKKKMPNIWNGLLRGGTNAYRQDRYKMFYPIIIDESKNRIVSVGDYLEKNVDRTTYVCPKGCIIAWPLHKDGTEGRWGMKPETLRFALKNGVAKLGKKDSKTGTWSMLYLKKKQLQQYKNGEIISDGKDENGALILRYPEESDVNNSALMLQEPRSLWIKDSHDASVYGSVMINNILKSKRFNFPKSLYAVHDTLRFFVANKPNALIVDFFAGSGTTLHAVNLLNAEDGGHRRCIMVTNNEVSDEEAKNLKAQGYKPSDEEWEKLGIAQYVTWPRTICSIKGHDINGEPLKGNYLGSDIPMEDGFKSNAIYFKLSFLDKMSVALGRQFKELLPILWMKAGAIGKCPSLEKDELPNMLVFPENDFAVLIDEKAYLQFLEERAKHPAIKTIYFVTDSENAYKSMARDFSGATTYQLYRDYLDNFRINVRR